MTTGSGLRVAVVVPVYRNAGTLRPLCERLAAALAAYDWRLRLVIDASPDDSVRVAHELAAADDRVAVSGLTVNVGQHAALTTGLAAEEDADVWVCLDADLQDPPEAVPLLLERLARGDVDAVFAGRRGRYESVSRRVTGVLHRRLAARLTGLPPDAGAFVARARAVRDAVVAAQAPSVVLAVGLAGRPVASVPVVRERRVEGSSAWSSSRRLAQSARSLLWVLRARRGR